MTTALKALEGGSEGKQMAANRAAHALNDALVTLRAGAKATQRYRSAAGVTVLTGGGNQAGYVWAVMRDKALVHFGGQLGQMIAQVADLVPVG